MSLCDPMYTPSSNATRLKWDLGRAHDEEYERFWAGRTRIPMEIFAKPGPIWLEIGAGSGGFCVELARRNPHASVVAIERCRTRGKTLVRKAEREALPNLSAFRGNAVPLVIGKIPTAALDRIYILYPCPWPKNSQRKHRWYLHPAMRHMVRSLRPGGLLIWASDQRFYIDEATLVAQGAHGLEILVHGAIAPNPHNDLEHSPAGRTKFEATFLAAGQPCYELVARVPCQAR